MKREFCLPCHAKRPDERGEWMRDDGGGLAFLHTCLML